MTGWQWCPGARGMCSQCSNFVEGLWRYFKNQTTSTLSVCSACAEEAASS